MKWKLDNFLVNFIDVDDLIVYLSFLVVNNINELLCFFEFWIIKLIVYIDEINYLVVNILIFIRFLKISVYL